MSGVITEENTFENSLKSLLPFISKYTPSMYWSDDNFSKISSNCVRLFEKDYDIRIFDNSNEKLCNSYPVDLIYIIGEKRCDDFCECKKCQQTVSEDLISEFKNNNIKQCVDDNSNKNINKNIITSNNKDDFPIDKYSIKIDNNKEIDICNTKDSGGGEYGNKLENQKNINQTSRSKNTDQHNNYSSFNNNTNTQLITPTNSPISSQDDTNSQFSSKQEEYDTKHLNDILNHIRSSRFARVHGRFVFPVIFFPKENSGFKYICRSATVSIGMESLYLNTTKYFSSYIYADNDYKWSSTQEQSNADLKLIECFYIKHIFDLMVAPYHTSIGGLTVTSSEFNDKEFYKSCNISNIPYPGVEFFYDYINLRQDAVNSLLKFDWDSPRVSARISINYEKGKTLCNWENYEKWSFIELTKKYLRLILRCISDENEESILIHCISGWDRTPLFISLIRLSLWADGLIHKSLSTEDMVYLTLAYDWVGFSHLFVDRLSRNLQVVYFCFDFLKYIVDSYFSINFLNNAISTVTSPTSTVTSPTSTVTSPTSTVTSSVKTRHPNDPPDSINNSNSHDNKTTNLYNNYSDILKKSDKLLINNVIINYKNTILDNNTEKGSIKKSKSNNQNKTTKKDRTFHFDNNKTENKNIKHDELSHSDNNTEEELGSYTKYTSYTDKKNSPDILHGDHRDKSNMKSLEKTDVTSNGNDTTSKTNQNPKTIYPTQQLPVVMNLTSPDSKSNLPPIYSEYGNKKYILGNYWEP